MQWLMHACKYVVLCILSLHSTCWVHGAVFFTFRVEQTACCYFYTYHWKPQHFVSAAFTFWMHYQKKFALTNRVCSRTLSRLTEYANFSFPDAISFAVPGLLPLIFHKGNYWNNSGTLILLFETVNYPLLQVIYTKTGNFHQLKIKQNASPSTVHVAY